MDLTRAKVFLYVLDSGSMSKAALAFDYTPSGISHMMTAFEDEVGFPLLIRTKTGVTPTPNALKLIPIIRAQCSWDERFCETVSEISGLTQGTLRIGSYSSIASQWLPEVIAAFHKDYPGIHIDLLEGVWQEVDNYLRERKADIGFMSYQPSIKYQWIPLKNDPMVVAMPPSHPLAQRDAVRLADIQKEPLIMPAFGSDIDVLNLLKEENIKVEYQFSTLQNYSAMGMVERGLGLLITNELITKGRTGNIKLMPFDPPRSINLGIAVPFENRLTPAVEKFIAYAKKIIQEPQEVV
ncbi:MAG: LysR family transcriptional regulator [Clostridia bacterium]|nr:LysR family transcriptional regulator [Clostridia bacterium]